MLLGHPRVVGLCSRDAIAHSMAEQLFDGALIKQFLDSILIQMPTHVTKGIGNLVVCPTYILDLTYTLFLSQCRVPEPVSPGKGGVKEMPVQNDSIIICIQRHKSPKEQNSLTYV